MDQQSFLKGLAEGPFFIVQSLLCLTLISVASSHATGVAEYLSVKDTSSLCQDETISLTKGQPDIKIQILLTSSIGSGCR